jgi:DNA-directed RNA polymerase specialized sigma24 family protein
MADGRPWWMDDPEIIELKKRALEEMDRRADEYDPTSVDEPDPVVADFYSGAASRELAAVRDELAAVRTRYRRAVSAARKAGLTWAEIGRLLGTYRQQVHRQFQGRLAD